MLETSRQARCKGGGRRYILWLNDVILESHATSLEAVVFSLFTFILEMF